MDIETKILELESKIDSNIDRLIDNMNKLHSVEQKINDNSKKIQKNTGALEILHTINNVKKRFYTMWLITFSAFLISVGFNIYLLMR